MGCTILFFVLLLALCPTLRINYRRPKTLNSDKVKKETLSERQGGIQFVILFERTHFLLIGLAQVSWSRDFKICWSYIGELKPSLGWNCYGAGCSLTPSPLSFDQCSSECLPVIPICRKAKTSAREWVKREKREFRFA